MAAKRKDYQRYNALNPETGKRNIAYEIFSGILKFAFGIFKTRDDRTDYKV